MPTQISYTQKKICRICSKTGLGYVHKAVVLGDNGCKSVLLRGHWWHLANQRQWKKTDTTTDVLRLVCRAELTDRQERWGRGAAKEVSKQWFCVILLEAVCHRLWSDILHLTHRSLAHTSQENLCSQKSEPDVKRLGTQPGKGRSPNYLGGVSIAEGTT